MFDKMINQDFTLDVTTKGTLFGASADAFNVKYAPVADLTSVTEVAGGCTEFVATVSNPRQIKPSVPAVIGNKIIRFDPSDKDSNGNPTTTIQAGDVIEYSNGNPTTTIQAGDVIEYADGMYVMVLKVVNGKAYLKTPLRAVVNAGDIKKQVGNTGIYKTANFSIPTAGDYVVMIYAPTYDIFIEKRISVIDDTVHTDLDAPQDTTAVAV